MVRRSFRLLTISTVLALLSLPASAADRPPKPPLIPANELLLGHSNFFRPAEVWDLQEAAGCRERLAPLSYKAYSAVGFNLANTIVLVGPDNGLIVVDTLGSDGSAKVALEAIRVKGAIKANADGKLPIKAIIYTHNHIDHTAGVQGVLALADRPACAPEDTNDAGQDGTYIGRQDCVEVVSQKQVVDSVINTATVVGEMINPRSSYMYGNWVGVNRINDGIGPEVLEGKASFQMPSRTFTNELLFSAAGVNLKLIYVPSETDDELAAFLPDGMNLIYPSRGPAPASASSAAGWGGPGMLLSAEVLQGPSFPNLYSLRGTGYRNPAQWFRSVDTLRELDSWSMVPAHGVPLCGAEDIRILLRNFRDAVQFTHDQALRRINQGHTIEELAAEIHMPEYLINDLGRMKKPKPEVRMEDYLTAFYGSVPQAVREIYFGYLARSVAQDGGDHGGAAEGHRHRRGVAGGGEEAPRHESDRQGARGAPVVGRADHRGDPCRGRAAQRSGDADLQGSGAEVRGPHILGSMRSGRRHAAAEPAAHLYGQPLLLPRPRGQGRRVRGHGADGDQSELAQLVHLLGAGALRAVSGDAAGGRRPDCGGYRHRPAARRLGQFLDVAAEG